MHTLLGSLIEICECAWVCARKKRKKKKKKAKPGKLFFTGGCNRYTDISTDWLCLKTLQSHIKLGHSFFCFFFENSEKLICKPDTNKQLMHKYAHNFKTKGEQLYLSCKGGFLSLSKQHRARLKSQNPPHVCVCAVCVCVFAPACLPPDVLSLSFSCLPLVTLPVALGASCQALLFSIHPSIPPSLPLEESALISPFSKEVLL